MDINCEKDLDLSHEKVGLLKDMLVLIFPDVFSIHKDFILRLTPDELKRGYMRQAAYWHPQNAEGLDVEELQARKMRYERLSTAYKDLLPHVTEIHQRLARIDSPRPSQSLRAEVAPKTVIAVGGAKGGVGKSVLAANLAVGLALLGQRVILADLDLGGSDAHLLVGVKSLSKTWNQFLEKTVSSVEEILTLTPFDGLRIIGGNSSRLGSANLSYLQKLKIIRQVKALDCDYVILDLGGDTSYNVLDFFLLADQKIVVTAAEPTSFLDTYNFVKVSFYRYLDRFFAENHALKSLCAQVHDVSLEQKGGPTLETVFQTVRSKDPSAYVKLRENMDQYRLSIVVNMAEHRRDSAIAESMQRLLEKNFFPYVGILGTIPFDTAVRKAARRFTPFIVDDRRCKASKVLHQMLAGILLLREPESVRNDLLEKTRSIRSQAKDRIGGDKMTLDALSEEQIQFISSRAPRLRDGFQKILRFGQS